MSAFIVTDQHIAYLIDAALMVCRNRGDTRFQWRVGVTCRILEASNASEVGSMLLAENYASVNYRYRENEESPNYTHELAGPVCIPTGRYVGRDVDIIAALKAIDCYKYQCCEHDEWTDSSARAFCQGLSAGLVCLLPGYWDATWETS